MKETRNNLQIWTSMGRSSWSRGVGNLRSFIGNSMGGLRGGANLASWVVAGTLAYFLWVKPSQDLKKQQQENGLIYGNKKKTDSKTEE
ncbi:hypothetical protein GOBAR_DD32198 [Gossypium barbadense]|nr:hypothetical protein GOBAR_DD32198 [Gossypium barbadense]